MTPEQITMARALAACRFCPGIGTKRFAWDMAQRANLAPDKPLTVPQATYLAQAVIRFRAQIEDDVVALARAALPQTTTEESS